MIRGRTRISFGAGNPGDPGGAGDPNGPGVNPPNDPTTRGPDDPGGYGGPVDVTDSTDPDGHVACSRFHVVSIQGFSAALLATDVAHFQGKFDLEYVAGEWIYQFSAPWPNDVIKLARSTDTSPYYCKLIYNGTEAAVYTADVTTHCPGQSLYPITAPTDRGLGDFAGSTCSVG